MPNESPNQENIRLIPAQFVREAVAAARRQRADWESLLKAVDIAATLDRPVHIEQFAQLWKAIGQAIGDDFLHLGARPLPPGALDYLAHRIVHAADFRTAMVQSLDYLRILIDRPRASLERDGTLAVLVFDDHDDRYTPFAYHLVWIIAGGLTGWLVGRRMALRQVDFGCGSTSVDADYRDIMSAPVRFSQPQTRFVFDADYLDMPVIRQPDSLDAFLAQLPGALLLRYWDERNLAAQIRRTLDRRPMPDWPTFEQFASDLEVPGSTLRRRLRAEGQSYRAIKDDIRRARAVRALLHSELSIEQIAEQLGFAEPSAFHRAFRKWVARSPGTFRRDHIGMRSS